MPRIVFDMNDREYLEFPRLRDGRPYRTIMLEALKIDETPRKRGPIMPSTWSQDQEKV